MVGNIKPGFEESPPTPKNTVPTPSTDNPIITMNQYMLIEFPMIIIPSNFLDTFFNLKMKGITPILAHPERYRFIQEDINQLEKLNDLEIIFQIDAGSLIGHFGDRAKETAFNMLNHGYCHLIGSDAHHDIKRNFCLQEAYDILSSFNPEIPASSIFLCPDERLTS